MNRLLLKIFILIVAVACSTIIEHIEEDDKFIKIQGKNNNLIFTFSGNINGETHPCGCRKFPLGGLPQVGGLHQKYRQNGHLIYFDLGDTFFNNKVLPKEFSESLKYKASVLAEAQKELNVKFALIGEQDFAAGVDYLQALLKKANYTLLISNTKPNFPFTVNPYSILEWGEKRYFIAGIVNPELFNDEIKQKLEDPRLSLKNILAAFKRNGWQEGNPKHQLILLSHSGLSFDKQLANDFPQFDWILGAHSQDFTQTPEMVGKTKICQVLEQNHYQGAITYNALQNEGEFEMVAIRTDLANFLKPNPFFGMIDKIKNEYALIQEKEKEKIVESTVVDTTQLNQKYKTFSSCKSCHEEQYKFWQTTKHSIAMTTLYKNNEGKNQDCIGCHALGFNSPKGFLRADDWVVFEEGVDGKKAYFEKFKKIFQNSGRPEHTSEQWEKFDQQMRVKQNFANVQCLHCHDQNSAHPFNAQDFSTQQLPILTKSEKEARFAQKCIQCHTLDRSPEWYVTDQKNRTINKLNLAYFSKQLPKVSCPKLQN
ncbi:MAG: multiheme c-type cytochrome [Bacteriovoracaceae bacterium]